MTKLRCLEIDAQPLMDLAKELWSEPFMTELDIVATEFTPTLKRLLETLPVGADGTRYCEVKVVFDYPDEMYEEAFADAWEDLGLEYIYVYRD